MSYCNEIHAYNLQNKLEEGREVYDEFFRWYPYCYGYWKKYSDHEKKNGFLDRAENVNHFIYILLYFNPKLLKLFD